MLFDKYKGFTKPYIVQHVTGTGFMEDPHYYKEVVEEFDSREEAEMFVDILSTWCNKNFRININTLSKEGKRLYNEFKKSLKKRSAPFKTKIGKYTFHHHDLDHQDNSFEIIYLK